MIFCGNQNYEKKCHCLSLICTRNIPLKLNRPSVFCGQMNPKWNELDGSSKMFWCMHQLKNIFVRKVNTISK